MTAPTLSDDEIAALTRRVRPSAQARILRQLSIPFTEHPDGPIIVYRWAVDPKANERAMEYEPDFS